MDNNYYGLGLMKKVSILGATGSIGLSTLSVIKYNQDKYSLTGLASKNNFKMLALYAKKFNAKFVAIYNNKYYKDLKSELSGSGIKCASGEDAVCEVACLDNDNILVSAIVGSAGLKPTVEAIKKGKVIAIANKESLVCAGDIIMNLASKYKSTIMPVDSEHNAIFQVFNFENRNSIKNITLTASGGPFLNKSYDYLKNVLPEEAIIHPKWSMGSKISIDSATMMNKGLEVIEASKLFNLKSKDIKVLVHPESIVHGIVEYIDGNSLSVMSMPDMRIAISSALSWPEKISVEMPSLDLTKVKNLSFLRPNKNKFPALELARNVLIEDGGLPIVLNAANEVAVSLFLNKNIRFTDIIPLVRKVIESYDKIKVNNVDEIILIDQEVRKITREHL